MLIKKGDNIPSVTTKRIGLAGMEDFTLADHIAGKKVVIFGVPGAFTPSCHEDHLPGYLGKLEEMRKKGVDEIICVSANDPFVMDHWAEVSGAKGKITMVPDGNCELIRAMGLDFDGSGAGLGQRSKRFSMIVENGTVESIDVEAAPSDVELSAADACMLKL